MGALGLVKWGVKWETLGEGLRPHPEMAEAALRTCKGL